MTGKWFAVSHVLLACLVAVILLMPAERSYGDPVPMLAALAVIEVLQLACVAHNKKAGKALDYPYQITALVWVLLLAWDIAATRLDILSNVLFPCPEKVFAVFPQQYQALLANVASSTVLLLSGFAVGMSLAVLLGAVVGWIPHLRNLLLPIAQLLAPIPATVYVPYLIAMLPTFRLASFSVVAIGIFFPNFLRVIVSSSSLSKRVRENARMLYASKPDVIFRIILPCTLAPIVDNLKTTMTSAILMLNFSEMLGATSGVGWYIRHSHVVTNNTQLLAGIIVMLAMVYALIALAGVVQRHACLWRLGTKVYRS